MSSLPEHDPFNSGHFTSESDVGAPHDGPASEPPVVEPPPNEPPLGEPAPDDSPLTDPPSNEPPLKEPDAIFPRSESSDPLDREFDLQAPDAPPTAGPQLIPSWSPPPVLQRIPNFGHLGILIVLILFGWVGAGAATLGAINLHLFGVSTIDRALTDVHYTLGSMIVLYLITFCLSLIIFPLVWNKSFFAGIQWNGVAALHLRWRLFGAASICFVLALLNGVLMPGPENAPIDEIFRAPGAAWLLFAFGITAAPFFEEMLFRGFLLPACCTAIDWADEKINGMSPLPLEAKGHPRWSTHAMIFASVFTSLPFAAMHAEQTGYSLGPFLLLICVSTVLCWARLSTRSLAASVLVHASYNCLLFSFMLLGTGGFKHLDKM
ncbi:MAG: CPBP family intramembrane glutamic endopeptidase [Terracidiphilus sp.]|jgi:membrane protease YdiL (CAAX protease family)